VGCFIRAGRKGNESEGSEGSEGRKEGREEGRKELCVSFIRLFLNIKTKSRSI
jgi:hypothetical protein